MKKIYLFLLLILTATSFGFGQLVNEPLTTGSLPPGWTKNAVIFETAAGGYARFTTTDALLTTSVFDASAYTSINVIFDVAKYGGGNDGPLKVEYSLNGGTNWVNAGNSSTPSGTSYLHNTISISNVSSTMKIRFNRSPSPSEKRLRNVVINGVGVSCPTYSLPFDENFDTAVPPTCWTQFRGTNGLGTSQQWQLITPAGNGETHNASPGAAFVQYENVTDGQKAEDWMVTPGIVLPSSANTKLKFWTKNGIDGDQGSTYSVKISTSSQTNIANFTNIITYDEPTLGRSYNQKVIDLSAYNGQTVYVAFVLSNDDGDAWYLDDVSIVDEVVCTTPSAATAFSATNIDGGSGTATLNWTRPADATDVLVVMKANTMVDAVAVPTDGTQYTGNPSFGSGTPLIGSNYIVYSGSASSVNISNLVPNTTYHVAIYSYNAPGYCYANDRLTGNFVETTTCGSFTLPFTEGFEGGVVPPSCWAVYDNVTPNTSETWGIIGSEHHTGNFSAYVSYDSGFSGLAEDWLVTPAISIPSSGSTKLSFFSKDGFPDQDYGSVYTVRISTTSQTDRNSFTTIATYGENDISNSNGDFLQQDVTINSATYGGSNVYIAFVMTQNNGDSWYLDDVKVEVAATIDNDTEIYAATPQVAAKTITAANTTTVGTAEDVFAFTIEDQGTSDALPTNITTMRFVPASGNTADWSDAIQGITLVSGATTYTPTTTTITDTDIVLTFATPVVIPNGTAVDFTLGAYLNTSPIVDGSILKFQIDASASGFTADASGSGLSDPFLLGTVIGNNITIDVDVTAIAFGQQPSDTNVNTAMSPDVTVRGVDANGNLDTDYNLDVAITSTGTLTGSPVTVTAVSGVATFSGLTHTAVGTGLVLTASDGLFTDVNSTTFDITVPPTFGWQISTVNQQYSIDFDNTVANVNNGAYTGAGFTTSPTAGQLNSGAWAATGLEDGFLNFGGTQINNDFSKGQSPGGVTSGGFYAFEVASGNYSFGVQPTTADFTPGAITLRAQNQTGQTVTAITFKYTVYIKNNEDRSNSFNFSYSLDNTSYLTDALLNINSPASGNSGNPWVATSRTKTVTGLNIAPGAYVFLRWTSDDVSGSNNRDEFGLDDISVIFNPVVNSNASTIVENGFDEPDNIDYTAYTAATGLTTGNAIKIGEFKLQDGDGSTDDSDMASTTLTEISFDVLNPSFIKTLAIFDDLGTNVSEVTGVTASTSFTGLNLEAIDNGSKVFSVYATFTTNVTDNEQIQLTVNSATALLTGSSFADPDAGAAATSIAGDDNKIEVTATDLIFTQQPTDSGVNAVMTPAVTLAAVDGNANIDLDFNQSVTLNTTGTTDGSATLSVNAVSGVVTFDNLIFSAPGTNLTLASVSSLTDSTSNTFNILILPSGLAFQSFGSDGGNWNYSTDPATFNNSDGTWDVVDNSFHTFSTLPSDGSFFFGINDLANNGGGTNAGDYGSISFEPVSVAGYENVTISFDYDVQGFDNGDDIDYEYFENGVSKAKTTFVDGNSNLDDNGTISIPVTPGVATVSLVIYVKQNGGSDYAALDNFNVKGFRKVFKGNQLTGFGGPIGTSTMEIIADAGPTINFKLNKGTGFFNDYLVIYIDSKAGGIATTADLTDTGDDGRKAISGDDGNGHHSTITFPPGFLPDYAISMNNGYAGLFEIVENGSHTFITSANLSPTGNNNASYTFDIDFSEIQTVPGAESFKFLATYLNASNAFRSNESYGRTTASGNPGAAPIEFETYYQVSSAKQGGKAPTQATGIWSDNDSWLNGNPPLAMDEITINDAIFQDVDVNAKGITINSSLEILPNHTLTTSDGIVGAGTLDVSGKLSITQGGYTDLIPTYTLGSTLEYKDVTDSVYNRYNEWTVGTDVGSGVPDNVILDNVQLDLTSLGGNTSDQDFNVGTNLSVLNGAGLNIDPTKNLTVGNSIDNINGSITLQSTSTRFASLISTGVSGTGAFNYNRFTNTNDAGTGAATGGNDLISAPFTGETFGTFAADNPNIVTDPNNANRKLFGPFSKSTGAYVIYNTMTDAGTTLDPGVGYRAAATAVDPATGSTFLFTGTANTGVVSQNIVNTPSLNFPEWNLIGNPYASYMNVYDFLSHEVAPGVKNIDLMVGPSAALYGYDGSASDGWITYNLLTDPQTLLAPGQGFFVTADAAKVAAYDIEFTPDMRRTGTSDDFIEGRNAERYHLKLQASKGSSTFNTDFYFTDMTTSGLDRGYDAAVFGNNAPSFSMYSHLVENNTGVDMSIQALAKTDLDSEIIVPLGINVGQGQQVTVGISESDLPSDISVYLEDNVAGTFTLLNTADYTFTAATTLNDTGRFFLRFTNSTLSAPTADLNSLQIYSTSTPRAIFVKGQLNSKTDVSLFDIQGRLVLSSVLESGTNSNQVDVSNISDGVYVVKLSNSSQQKTQKVIVK